jgi:hypothetical protein
MACDTAWCIFSPGDGGLFVSWFGRRARDSEGREEGRAFSAILRSRELSMLGIVFYPHWIVLERSLTPVKRRPNKAPEPTTKAVTPRAMVRPISRAHFADARGAPAMVVAHL